MTISLNAIMKRKPVRMWLTNLASTEEMPAHYNPTEVKEKIQVNYGRLKVLGLSHEVLQYQNTGNLTLDFSLAFRAFDDNLNRVKDIGEMKKFMYALCYPRRGAADIAGGAPPRCLFIWPNYASLTCVLTGMEWTNQLFARDGTPTLAEANLTIEEIRDFRLYSEDVRDFGLQRAGAGAGGSNI